jgi:hypothetical protein
MSGPDLSDEQTLLLETLVSRYRESDERVKGDVLADELGWDIGQVRNQMQSLEALQLAEGVPGPKGGYKPRLRAYEMLDLAQIENPAETSVYLDETRLDDVNVERIRLSEVHNPDACTAEVTLLGPTARVSTGDSVTVGPTPCSALVIYGTVAEIAAGNHRFVLSVERMEAPAQEPYS